MAKKSKHEMWLTDDENLLCAAEESGSKEPKFLLLTNKRLILIQQLANKELSDVDYKMWKEFKAVSLRQAFWNSTISVTFSVETAAGLWTFEKIKKSVAATAYRLMKNKEIAKREAVKPKPKKDEGKSFSVDVKLPVTLSEIPQKELLPAIKNSKPALSPPAEKPAPALAEDKKDAPKKDADKATTDAPLVKDEAKKTGFLDAIKSKFT